MDIGINPFFFRHILYMPLFFLLKITCSYANIEFDITASVISSSCQITISNGGIVNLDTVTPDYFSEDITPESDYPGGEYFSIDIVSCENTQETQSQIKIDFQPKTNPFSAGNHQVFTNELEQQTNGAKNVGIVIFSAQESTSTFNVLTSDGKSRAIYPVTPTQVAPSSWRFYSRMQRIDNSRPPSTGLVRSQVIVSVTYE